jgi:hypothetical protein
MTGYFLCPKCNRPLPPSGEVVVEGHACPVYQCDECIVRDHRFGDMEFAYTFAVGPDGKPFDPAGEGDPLPY